MSGEPRLDHHAHCAYPFCTTPAVIYADRTIPFCRPHAEAVFRHLADHLPGAGRARRRVSSATRSAGPTDPTRPSLVYFGRVDDGHIKIGHTTSPERRWTTLRNYYGRFDILAAEPGGVDVELLRQGQFAHLRIGRSELFRSDPALAAHLDHLQSQDWRRLVDEVQEASAAAVAAGRRSAREKQRVQREREKARFTWAPPKENLRRLA